MLSQDHQPGSGVDPSSSAVTGNLSSSTEPLADLPRGSSAVLRTAIDRLAALLWKPTTARPAEPASSLPSTQSAPPAAPSAAPGLEPILYISWRSAVSDERGESFLATTPSGAVVICEGTPQNPGKQLWSAEPAAASEPAVSEPAVSEPAPVSVAPPPPPPAPARPSRPPLAATAPTRISRPPAAPPAPTRPSRPPLVAQPPRPAPRSTVQEVFISSRQSGKRLALDGSRAAPGARLILQPANGGAHQRFFISPHQGGYLMRAAHSPITINAAIGRSQGFHLIEMPSHKGDDQGFSVEETAEGDYRIRAPQSGRWLATANINGTEVPVLDASQGEEHASRWVIHSAPETPRLAVLDLQSVAPRPKTDGALDVMLGTGQLQCVDALAGSTFRAYTGDFLKRGRDQLMLVRADSRYHYVDILEFGVDGAEAQVISGATVEPGGWIDGWLGPHDLQLTGDLTGDGSSQLLLLHRGQRRPGEQAVLLGLQDGCEHPRKLFSDNWGERQWLDGWLDPDDVHMVGDFMGLGHDQWMMMNRNPRGGRVRVIDLKGGTPRRCYTEMWGQSPLLDGWMDSGRVMLAGDFLKRGHAQVLFINRNIAMNTGKVLIADFCRAAPPAEVGYRELWGQSDLLNDFLADPDIAVAGDFMGRGYAQALFVSRKGEGEKFLVADFHRGAPPLEPCVREQWGTRGRHESLVHPRSVVLAGRFRRPVDSAVAPAQVLLL